MSDNRIVRVGIIGCGEVSQIIHIPTLSFLSHLFEITYLCDVSKPALDHCLKKILGKTPRTTTSAVQLCASWLVDVVFVVNSDEYHVNHAILALKHDKMVFIEKPMALNQRGADAIIAAEKESDGRVMVGYMRRYAAGFTEAIREIGGIEEILYARVRDIIGHNSLFTSQSGTFARRFDYIPYDDIADKKEKGDEMVKEALETDCGVKFTPENYHMWRLLGGLGSHDLSAMREVLGMPEDCTGTHINSSFWGTTFRYPKFAVVYESGINMIPRFDAHIEVYGKQKAVRVQYDTPYIKGLPITVHVQENIDGALHERTIRKTFEDAYTTEMLELWSCMREGKQIKTTAEDAKMDLVLFSMFMRGAQPKQS